MEIGPMSHTRIYLDLDRGMSLNGAALRLFRLTPETIHVPEEFKFWLNYGNGYGGASSRHTFAALIGPNELSYHEYMQGQETTLEERHRETSVCVQRTTSRISMFMIRN